MAKKTTKSEHVHNVSPKEMNVKLLLEVMAFINVIAGLALIGIPVFLSGAVLGFPISEPGAIVVSRVAGAAILSLGIVCWMLISEARSRTGKSLVTGMAVFNTLLMLVMVYAITIQNISSPGLWVVVLVYSVLAGWCIRTAINMRIVSIYQKLF